MNKTQVETHRFPAKKPINEKSLRWRVGLGRETSERRQHSSGQIPIGRGSYLPTGCDPIGWQGHPSIHKKQGRINVKYIPISHARKLNTETVRILLGCSPSISSGQILVFGYDDFFTSGSDTLQCRQTLISKLYFLVAGLGVSSSRSRSIT